jgi:hypothetical protein
LFVGVSTTSCRCASPARAAAARELRLEGRLEPEKATAGERHGKARFAIRHPAPFYLVRQMHDLYPERFLKDAERDGPNRSFTHRGIKDSPPYLHDGRCLTPEDTVEFFNLVPGLRQTKFEKHDPVAFLRQLWVRLSRSGAAVQCTGPRPDEVSRGKPMDDLQRRDFLRGTAAFAAGVTAALAAAGRARAVDPSFMNNVPDPPLLRQGIAGIQVVPA